MPPSYSVDPDQFLDLSREAPFCRAEGIEAWEKAYAALESHLRVLGSGATLFVVFGLQASGKSTWVRQQLALCRENAVFFSGPLPSRMHRARALAMARACGAKAIAVWVQVPVEVALARNAKRTGLARVPDEVIHHVHESLEPPAVAEGFAQILHVATNTTEA